MYTIITDLPPNHAPLFITSIHPSIVHFHRAHASSTRATDQVGGNIPIKQINCFIPALAGPKHRPNVPVYPDRVLSAVWFQRNAVDFESGFFLNAATGGTARGG